VITVEDPNLWAEDSDPWIEDPDPCTGIISSAAISSSDDIDGESLCALPPPLHSKNTHQDPNIMTPLQIFSKNVWVLSRPPPNTVSRGAGVSAI